MNGSGLTDRGGGTVESRDGPSRFLVCGVGSHRCGLPLECVAETMRPLPTEPIGGAPAFVRGVAMLRGGAVPVVDAGLLVGGRSSQSGRFVSLRVDGRRVALAVDAVMGIETLPEGPLGKLPPLLEGASEDAIESIGALDGELFMVLEAARLVPESLWTLVEQEPSR